ncbi:MAG: propionyl-CoA synthetase [Candidatus Promineifilaceae bacterium]
MNNATTYAEAYAQWQANPTGFWEQLAEDIHWYKRWDTALDKSEAPIYRWFAGGETNTCYNALDRHVENGRADQLALIYDSPITHSQRKFTYRELRDEVAKLAGVIRSMGVEKGDRVIIYMPMVPEAAMAMLACARIGAIHSVVFGGFAANELATRIDDAQPKLIMSASCGIEPSRIVAYKPLLDESIRLAAHQVDKTLILQRSQHPCDRLDGRDFDWDEMMASAESTPCVPVLATDPCYILYTSGTTGQPKGVVRDTGGHMVALKWSMKSVYDVDPGDVYWAASDVGWVVGHSYIVYAPLLHGCTSIMYEGKPVGTPDAGAFWRVIEEHGVNVMFTAPTAFRAIKRQDPQGKLVSNYDLSKFRALYLAGERCDSDTLHWAEDKLGVPVIDHWWQTETGWSICANPMGIELLPVKPGSAGVPMPGYDVQILDPDSNEMAANEIGAVVVKLPLPPSSLPTLWQRDDLYKAKYLEHHVGYYSTADAGFKDEDGYLHIMARTDDIINVAGHRLSTGGMEEVLAGHPDVAECAVLGVKDELKGEIPIGLLVLNAGVERDHADIVKEVIQRVRNQIGPVAAFKKAVVVKRLPKTRSGKILRGTIKRIADKTPWKMPATIDDPVILDEMAEAVAQLGYGQ